METLTLGLLLLAAVLLSSIIDQMVPRVSLPLVQIATGVIIGMLASGSIDIELDPEIFLVLFIAPLLFDEAKNADKASLWRNRKPILSLAIGLVVATTLIIGFAVNFFIPSIPLAAAFALGAALGPTDAVAVSSLSKQISIPEREASLLKGELLLNDASGIVSFQFALAAAITGTFSLAHATVDFLMEFIGGLVAGVVLGLLAKLLVRKVREIGVENTTFHVLFEVFTPFLVYLLSQSIHVSGIIAVVVAGLFNVIAPRTDGPAIARMNIVSSSVWHVIAFALNGIVFVLLGTQLPNAMRSTWDDVSIDNLLLIAYIVGITVVLLGIRFIWVLCMEKVHLRATKERFSKRSLQEVLITTLSGAKGTITLSIMFTIPVYVSLAPPVRFPQRDLLIFLACGVIVCTLLIATFIVPLVAPKRNAAQNEQEMRQQEAETMIDILRSVIEHLAAHQTDENRASTQVVIRSYNERIANVKDHNDIEDEANIALRIQTLHWEEERVLQMLNEGEVSGLAAYRYINRLEHIEHLLRHSRNRFSPRRAAFRARTLLRRGVHTFVRELPNSNITAGTEEIRKIQIAAELYVIDILRAMVASPDEEVPTEDAAKLLLEYQNSVAIIQNSLPTVTSAIRMGDCTDAVKRYAYGVELEQIQEMYEEERLTRATARRLRENVQMMQLDLDDRL